MSQTAPESKTFTAQRRRQRHRSEFAAIAACVAVIAAIVAVGVSARGSGPAENPGVVVHPPRPAHDFVLPILANGAGIGRQDGRSLMLSSLRGHLVLLSFWASWCPPCRRDAPRLEAVWLSSRGQGLMVVGVDTQDHRSDAAVFVRRAGLTFPIVLDTDNRAFGTYGLMGLPETFLIDPTGRIRVHWIGEISEADLSRQVPLVSG